MYITVNPSLLGCESSACNSVVLHLGLQHKRAPGWEGHVDGFTIPGSEVYNSQDPPPSLPPY